MNHTKLAQLAELNKRHDETYEALVEARRKRDEVRRMEIGPEVEARHEFVVATKKAALQEIDDELEILRREHERCQAERREEMKLNLSLAALTLSLLGNLLQWLRWL